MSERSFTPEEFARLMSLPDDHPDRRAVAGSAEFEARMRMHDAFVTSRLESLEDGGGGARAELAARLDRALRLPGGGAPRETGVGSPASVAGSRSAAGHPATTRAPARGPGWLARLSRALGSPALRPAFALAAIALVTGVAWWAALRDPEPEAVRGSAPSGAFTITEARDIGRGVQLSWTPVPDADEYAVVVLGPDLREITHFDRIREPSFRLEPDALPGVPASGEVQVEVRAFKRGDPIATSTTRAIRLR